MPPLGPPPDDPSEPTDPVTTSEPEGRGDRPGDWPADDGSDGAEGAWRPEDPAVWGRSQGADPAPRPGRIRRTAYHRRRIGAFGRKGRASGQTLDLTVRSPRQHRWRGLRRGRLRRGGRRRVLKIVLLLIGILVVGTGAAMADAYYHSYTIYKEVRGLPTQLTATRQRLAAGDVPPDDQFATMTAEASGARHELDNRLTIKLVRRIPFFNRPIVALDQGVDAAVAETQAATAMGGIVRDALGTVATGQTPFAAASTTPIFHDGKVDVALLERLTPRLQAVADDLRVADAAIRAIPPVPFVHRLDSLKAQALTESSQAITLVDDALAGAKLLPSFLGADTPKTYFLAMQNNADQRATGGAVLAYAFIRIDQGDLKLVGGGSVYDFDKQFGFTGVHLPPDIQWYVDHVPKAHPRLANINYSPDLPVVAQAWAAVLEKATGTKIDGAIAIDPIAVSYLLGKRTISVPAYPKPITAGNIVSVVENGQYTLPFAQQQAFPAQLIAKAWEIVKNPSPFVRTIKQMALAIKQRDLQLWSTDPAQEALLQRLGWDAGLPSGGGDLLYVTDSKIMSNKVDYYTHLSVEDDVVIDAQGNATSTVKVTIQNDTPPHLSRFIVGPNAYGINKALIGLFAPSGATLQSADPADGPPDHTESGHQVFLRIVSVLPGHPQTVRFTYTIPNVVTTTPTGKVYKLAIGHQPFVNPVQLKVTVTLPEGTTIRPGPGWTVTQNVATLQTELTQDLVRQIGF